MNRLNDRQNKFLREVENSLKPLVCVIDDNDLSPGELSEWLRDDAFRQAIKELKRRLFFVREMDVLRGGALAAKRLFEGTFGNFFIRSHPQLRACVQLCRLAKIEIRTKKSPRREPLRPGYHPSVPIEEAQELVARLGAD